MLSRTHTNQGVFPQLAYPACRIAPAQRPYYAFSVGQVVSFSLLHPWHFASYVNFISGNSNKDFKESQIFISGNKILFSLEAGSPGQSEIGRLRGLKTAGAEVGLETLETVY